MHSIYYWKNNARVSLFSLIPGRYLIDCYGPQGKFGGENIKDSTLLKGQHVSISITIEGKAQHFTVFLGNMMTQNIKSNNKMKETIESTLIILNSMKENIILAIAESGRLTQNIEASITNLVSQLDEKPLMISSSSLKRFEKVRNKS